MPHTNHVKIKESQTELVQKVAALIKERRLELEMHQSLLSKLSGVEVAYISRLERGLRPGFTFGIVAKLFTALKIDFAEVDKL
jgi:transcriptional regulator with XRE-family HTH domain